MGTRIDIAPKPDELELPPPGFSLAPIPEADVSAALRPRADTPVWNRLVVELGGCEGLPSHAAYLARKVELEEGRL